MRYSILIYDSEETVEALSDDEEAARIGKHQRLQESLRASRKLGPVARLESSNKAVTLRATTAEPFVVDGPFAETKEQLVGFYVVECDSIEEAVAAARELPLDSGSLEVRPIGWFEPGV